MKQLHTFAVCAYKESPYLEECIRSLLFQTVSSNIIIATSTPNDYISSIAEKYDLPLIVNPGESGITQDWNFAYTHTDSKYVTIAHQDDIYDAEYLETALKKLEGARRPLIFFSDYYEIRENEKTYSNRLLRIKRLMLLPIRLPMAEQSRWIRRRILSFGSPICCPSVTFAKANLPYAVFQHGFRACEDWQAWEMISKLKGDFLYSPRALMAPALPWTRMTLLPDTLSTMPQRSDWSAWAESPTMTISAFTGTDIPSRVTRRSVPLSLSLSLSKRFKRSLPGDSSS